MIIEDDDCDEEFPTPKYSDVGWVVVKFSSVDLESRFANYEIDEVFYDGSAYWIQEGIGFDYWLTEEVDYKFKSGAWYLISGVYGEHYRGDWSYGEDDDEVWYYDSIKEISEDEAEKYICL